MQKKTPNVNPPGNRLGSRGLHRPSQSAPGDRRKPGPAVAGVGAARSSAARRTARLGRVVQRCQLAVGARPGRAWGKVLCGPAYDGGHLVWPAVCAAQLLHRWPRRRPCSTGRGAWDCGRLHARFSAAHVPGRGGRALRGRRRQPQWVPRLDGQWPADPAHGQPTGAADGPLGHLRPQSVDHRWIRRPLTVKPLYSLRLAAAAS